MARTPSTMLELGTLAPDFTLPDPVTDQQVSLSDYSSQPLLVIFSCNHCPYVLHILQPLTELLNQYRQKGIQCVMINANDVVNYSADSPEQMVALSQQLGFDFPYLYDESQQTAKAYQAACTPDIFLFDGEHRLFYRGQFDSARPGNQDPITGYDLKNAMDALLQNLMPPDNQMPSLGCNIKWKAGNEPEYF